MNPPAPDPREAPLPAELLDLTGEVCPFTFVRMRLALEALPLGSELRVLVDHEPASRNLPRSAREWGQEILAVDAAGPGRWTIDVRKRVP
ncbi:MAG: sulfurtransferase TusA family protein [Deltaproteobacteria bacterium]|nr:sulfurtransferase TusA family protein [Deltaproteobacteria bacterium]